MTHDQCKILEEVFRKRDDEAEVGNFEQTKKGRENINQ